MDTSDEPFDSGGRRSNFALHASTGIEHNTHADGQIIGLAEVSNLLGLTAFYDDQIILCQVGHIVSGLIRHRGDDIDQGYVDLQLSGYDRGGEDRANQKDQTNATHMV